MRRAKALTRKVPTNLRSELSSFIGREHEIAEVRQLLATARLVTLTGGGGTGKTRLALHMAATLLDSFVDGVWCIELAPLSDPSLVLQIVAATLDVREQPGQPLITVLAAAMGDHQLLLILDNCEHVIEATALAADALMRACPNLQILATSREALNIAGEMIYLVPPLNTPNPKSQLSFAQLQQSEAIRLFVERAMAAQAHFALTEQNAAAIAQICQSLDGIPLAIELAAVRVKALSVEQIAARLDDAFLLLTGGPRGALPHHQTLRAALDWSHSLLTEPECVLFRRISVFMGGWTLEAAEMVCAGSAEDAGTLDRAAVLDVLTQLVNKSLVLAAGQAGEMRYRLLEPARQYGRQKLSVAGEVQRARNRHLAFFQNLAREGEPHLRGAEQLTWLSRLEQEHDNLRAALEWSLNSHAVEAGLSLAAALHFFWNNRVYGLEGRRWLEALLMLAGPVRGNRVYAKALWTAGSLARTTGDLAIARSRLEESLAIFRALDDQAGIADVLMGLGIEAAFRGDYAGACSTYERSLALSEAIGYRWAAAVNQQLLGLTHFTQGEDASARSLLEQSAVRLRELGDKIFLSRSLSMLSTVAIYQAEYAGAQTLIDEARTMLRESGDPIEHALILRNQVYLELSQGRRRRATELLREILLQFVKHGRYAEIPSCLRGIACILGAQAQWLQAVRMLGAEQGMCETLGLAYPAAYPSVQLLMRPELEAALSAARTHLGEVAFDEARAAGRALTIEQAIAEAQSVIAAEVSPRPEPAQPPAPQGATDTLSAREVEVLRLLAQGMTDFQIAEALTISARTVNAHLRSIYSKLDVNTRTAAARYASKLNLPG